MQTDHIPVSTQRARPPADLPKATLVERKDYTRLHSVFKFRPHAPFTFKPGQYCTIGVDGIERAYSIASAPHEPLIELFIELVPSGELTPHVWKLRGGEEVTIRPRAKGVFTLDQNAENHLMVATVTGIAPFVSMLRDHFHSPKRPQRFFVMHGASYYNEFLYDVEVGSLARAYPEAVTYFPAVSRATDESNCLWRGAWGRINTLVDERLRTWDLKPENTVIYGCGHPGMVEDLKARLAPRGFKVKEERYWAE